VHPATLRVCVALVMGGRIRKWVSLFVRAPEPVDAA
jgi:hypothetical protein